MRTSIVPCHVNVVRDFGKWEKYTTGFGSRILAKVINSNNLVHASMDC